ncbi:MAG: sulfatase-like hydrolase/transferase [Planctomycetaceae bacterium]|nr:sulfatase-like hydrolase/transferase [Planctomycetaceae bacterium]
MFLLFALVPLAAQTTVCFAAAAAPSAETKPPNILVLVSDDQRPDTLGVFGNSLIRTPHLDALAARGTRFTRATCSNPICTPSRAEIMTGASGFRNGVGYFGGKIRPEMALWADTFRQAGYETCYVGKWHNDGTPQTRGYVRTRGLYRGGGGKWAVPSFDWNGRPVTGYRGWIFYDEEGKPQPKYGTGLTAGISQHFADDASAVIEEAGDRPFFLHVNFTAPHDPLLMPYGYEAMYNPDEMPVPENFLAEHPFDHGNFDGRDERLFEWPRTPKMVRDELAVYYAVISHLDAQIGRVLAALEKSGQQDNTIVIFTSDHGLAVGSHGLRGKQSMYEHTIGVPLILAGPGIPRNEHRDAQCYLRDLFPTTCDLAGLEIPDSVEGRSLRPVLDGSREEIYEAVFGMFRNSQRMIRTAGWKLIDYPQAGRRQLFDLQHDPLEKNDLSRDPQHMAKQQELLARLRTWQREHDDPVLKTSSGTP